MDVGKSGGDVDHELPLAGPRLQEQQEREVKPVPSGHKATSKAGLRGGQWHSFALGTLFVPLILRPEY